MLHGDRWAQVHLQEGCALQEWETRLSHLTSKGSSQKQTIQNVNLAWILMQVCGHGCGRASSLNDFLSGLPARAAWSRALASSCESVLHTQT
jgi:hypothetical protein